MNFKIDTSSFTKPSGLLIIFCFCFSFFTMDLWKSYHFKQNVFSWDIANYYSYLPAKFCNNGSFEFHNGIEAYLGVSPINKRMSRGTYGMAVMYAPAFALGYKIAINQDSPRDGFSEPFSTCLHWASMLYGLFGLIFLRNFLIKFFSEITTTVTLGIVFFGTMLFYYTISLGEMPHGYLFFLISAFLLLTYKWHEKVTYTKTILIGIVIGMISLIRPTEALVVLIFIFWNVRSIKDIKPEILKFFGHYLHVLIIITICILIWVPQLIYWKEMTGTFLYSPYAALGEKFYWTDPQIINILFSYRKGWVTYTPLILLAFAGFFFMRGEIKKLRPVIILILCVNVYMLSCWWDWFFGGGFGARGFCQHIAFLSIPIASCCDYFLRKENRTAIFQFTKVIFFAFIFSGISLNLGQTYQFAKLYIHFNSMTKETYWLVFGKYYLDEEHMSKFWNSLKEPDYKKLKSGEDRSQ